MKKILKAFLMVFFLLFIWNAQSQLSVDVDGGRWNVDLTNETIEAGNDFIGTYTSATDQVIVDVLGIPGGRRKTNWTVSLRYEPRGNWDTSVEIYAQRTGEGDLAGGGNRITAGTTYQLVTTTNQTFFTGRTNREVLDIPIQYQLRNISVLIPTFPTTPYFRARVIYTVIEN